MCDFCLVLSYVFSLLKFSLCSFISLPTAVSLFMTMTSDSLSCRSLIFLLLMSFSEVLSCSSYWTILLCIFILPKCVFAPLIQVNQQSLLVLKEQLNLDVLRVKRYNPTYTRARCSRGILSVGSMCLLVVMKTQLLV